MILIKKFSVLVAIAAQLTLPTTVKSQYVVIDAWNQDNVVTEAGPRVEGEVYRSDVYAGDPNTSTSYGGIVWVESDVQAPGMKVVANGEGGFRDGSCVMTSGFDPENPGEEKQCNDAFKTSKRFKRVSRDSMGYVDLVFDVEKTETEPTDQVYRIFEKYENLTPDGIASFKIQLGTGIGGSFTEGGGISFTKRSGDPLEPTIDPYDCEDQENSLAAFFAFGLFGNASENDNHDLDGYFDPTKRSCFKLQVVSSVEIATDGLSGEVADVYGSEWMSKAQAPIGFFYDIDNKPSTDNLLVGDWDGDEWVTRLSCSSPVFQELLKRQAMKESECVDYDVGFDPVPLSDSTLKKWIGNPRLFNTGLIEDHGNVNLNYHIKVDPLFAGPSFTLRITPTPGTGENIYPYWLENLPWESDVSVSFRDDLETVAVGSTRNVAVVVENQGPDEVVTGEIFLRVKNSDGTVGFRKTLPFSKLKAGTKITLIVKNVVFPTSVGEVDLEVEVEAFGASDLYPGDNADAIPNIEVI